MSGERGRDESAMPSSTAKQAEYVLDTKLRISLARLRGESPRAIMDAANLSGVRGADRFAKGLINNTEYHAQAAARSLVLEALGKR